MSAAAPGPVAALVLAVLQGLTEFLPVSSSGHLAAAQIVWPALAYPGVTLEVALHVGTTLAVLLYYRGLLANMATGLLGSSARIEGLPSRRWLLLLALGSIPTAAIGLGAEGFFRAAFEDLGVVAACLAVTGAVLLASRWAPGHDRSLTVAVALAVGTVQGIAILPGISRSGVTISLALLLGIGSRQAVTFSFLLSVPAVAGAALLDARHAAAQPFGGTLFAQMAFATLCAGAVGYVCIGLVHRATRRRWWHHFAWYCWGLAAVLAWLAWR